MRGRASRIEEVRRFEAIAFQHAAKAGATSPAPGDIEARIKARPVMPRRRNQGGK